MATQAYWDWVAAGRPFRLARPVRELRDWAYRHNVQVLGTIGNEAHLTADFPEDHTPFSFTAWPVPLDSYVVCAIDLADRGGLGAAILAQARQGELPWLKYMNIAGRNYAYADRFRQGAPNSDQHIHLSIFSDELSTDIDGFDPWGNEVSAKEIWDHPLRYPPSGNTMTAADRLMDLQADIDEMGERLGQLRSAIAELPGLVANAVSEATAALTAAQVAEKLEISVREPV